MYSLNPIPGLAFEQLFVELNVLLMVLSSSPFQSDVATAACKIMDGRAVIFSCSYASSFVQS